MAASQRRGVALLCLASAACTRIMAPTALDIEEAWAQSANDGVIFKENCARSSQDAETCEARWVRWVAMRARDIARRREVDDGGAARGPLRPPGPFAAPGSSPQSYDALPLGPGLDPLYACGAARAAIALGVVSGAGNGAHRRAIRATWARAAGAASAVVRFFAAVPSDGELPAAFVNEMAAHRDFHVCNFTESYAATFHKTVAIFRWGARVCGSWYTLRANDDVYLRLERTARLLFATGPPSRLYGGLFVDGAAMRVPRAESVPRAPDGVPDDLWLRANKAWVVSRGAYPADAYPDFAQGNAYVLSWDLAEALAAVGDAYHRSAVRDLPDDVAAALLVDAAAGGGERRLLVPADYAFEGRWTACSADAFWHFNLHPEHMYDLDLAEPGRSWRRAAFDVDGAAVAVDFDDAENVSAVARDLAVDHVLLGIGCPKFDAGCVADSLAPALAAAPTMVAEDQCATIPDGLFCCG